MSKWVEAAESALAELKKQTAIPYNFERFCEQVERLPDTYAVYFLVSAPSVSSADNKERVYEVRIQVSLFYRNKSTFLTIPDKIIAAFTEAGFCRASEGRIPYQTNTGHCGWRCEFIFYERR